MNLERKVEKKILNIKQEMDLIRIERENLFYLSKERKITCLSAKGWLGQLKQ